MHFHIAGSAAVVTGFAWEFWMPKVSAVLGLSSLLKHIIPSALRLMPATRILVVSSRMEPLTRLSKHIEFIDLLPLNGEDTVRGGLQASRGLLWHVLTTSKTR